MPQGYKSKQGQKAKAGHQSRKQKPKQSKVDKVRGGGRKDGSSTAVINKHIEATMIGRVHNSQEILKLVDRTFVREGTVNYGKEKTGRQKMREGRTTKEKIVLKR